MTFLSPPMRMLGNTLKEPMIASSPVFSTSPNSIILSHYSTCDTTSLNNLHSSIQDVYKVQFCGATKSTSRRNSPFAKFGSVTFASVQCSNKSLCSLFQLCGLDLCQRQCLLRCTCRYTPFIFRYSCSRTFLCFPSSRLSTLYLYRMMTAEVQA